ncbi:TonB-dependent receptor [Caulobacter sp. 1776]|uniref:TonB-dependent receptor family protein n=1 Tax=Caulobacter sp. 1776 TaxID=3156420 RepID=UPI0033910EF1
MKALLLATASLLAVAPSLARADPTETVPTDAVEVSSVIVTAQRDPEDPPAVAGARRTLSRTPGAVSVVAQESYVKRQALALDDMLHDCPGVYAQRKWGGDVRISIRGSGLGNASHNRGLILALDGVPFNEADGYGDSQAVDPLLTRYVEVYRGGNALRFGGALLGGAINMTSPTGANAGYGLRLRADGGAFGLAREHVSIAHRFDGGDVFAAITNQTADGFRPQSQQNIQFATLNIGRKLGETGELRLIVNGANINQEIPGALTWAQFVADRRQAAPSALLNNQGRNQRSLRASLRANSQINREINLEAAVYATWKDLDHPIFQVLDQQSRNYGAFARLDWQGKIGGKPADAYLGAWYREGDLDGTNYVNNHGARGAPQALSQQNATAADVFGEARYFVVPRLALVGGLTAGVAKRHYRSFHVPGAAASFDLDARTSYDWISPRVGLLWEDEAGAQVFANVTRSVEPPNFGSLSPSGAGFAAIRAQTAWTWEAGLRGRHGAFTYDLTAYRARLRGEMLQYAVDSLHPATTFNAGATTHQGLEAAIDWKPARGWRLRQSWTLSDFHFVDDSQYGDNRLPITPRSFYRGELRYTAPAGWFVAPSVEWSATRQWIDYRNTRTAPSYAIVNLNLGWKLTDRASMFVDARNLLDKTYVSNVQAATVWTESSAVYWPGDKRSVFGGVTVEF